MSSVGSIMQRDLVVATAAESIESAIERLRRHDVGALLLVDGEGRLTGIVSERDLVRRVLAGGHGVDGPIGEVATPTPKAVAEGTSIKECTRLFRESGFRHLPVVDADGRAVGILSSRDLMIFVVEGLEGYIARHRAEKHLEEMVDPYDSLPQNFGA